MIAERMVRHLEAAGVPFDRHTHDRAVTAQELAEALGVGGYQVAKTVLVDADGRTWMAILPAPQVIDIEQLRRALGAKTLRLLEESELAPLFPDCDTGAEPPFGSLYGVPVVLQRDLAEEPQIIFRAGSHEEAISMNYEDFARLESPIVAQFAVPLPARAETEAHV